MGKSKQQAKPLTPSEQAAADQKNKKATAKKQKWGPYSAILMSMVIFVLPSLIMVIAIEQVGGALAKTFYDGDDVAFNFVFFGISELLAVGLLLIYLKRRKAGFLDLGFVKKGLEKLWMVIPTVGIYFVTTTILFLISSIWLSDEVLDQEQVVGFEDAIATSDLALAFVSLVIIAPIIEEMIFRGFMFQGMRQRWNFGFSAFASAALFGLAHGQINVAIDVFVLAIALAWLMERTQNIWVPIGLHSLKNLIAFTFVFIVDAGI